MAKIWGSEGSKSGVSGVKIWGSEASESGKKSARKCQILGFLTPYKTVDSGILGFWENRWFLIPGIDRKKCRFHKKKCLLANVEQKNTVSWGIVHAKPEIGPLLGRSFEKWNVL